MSVVAAKRNIKASNGSVKRTRSVSDATLKRNATDKQIVEIERLTAGMAHWDRARIIVLAQRANREWAERTIQSLQARRVNS